jgi:hypothetical protein
MYDLVWIYFGEADIIESGLSIDNCEYLVNYLYQFAVQGSALACEVSL